MFSPMFLVISCTDRDASCAWKEDIAVLIFGNVCGRGGRGEGREGRREAEIPLIPVDETECHTHNNSTEHEYCSHTQKNRNHNFEEVSFLCI